MYHIRREEGQPPAVGVVLKEQGEVGEPSAVVFVRVGADDTLHVPDLFLPEREEGGGADVDKVERVTVLYRVAHTLADRGEEVGVTYNGEANPLELHFSFFRGHKLGAFQVFGTV